MADPMPPIATPDKPEKISRTMMKFISLAVAIVVWYVIYDTASLSYTNFFDGRYNTLVDRDFVALSFGMNF